MALPRLETRYEDLNPYDVDTAIRDEQSQRELLRDRPNQLATALKKINQRKAVMEYFNATAYREVIVAPTLRLEYRYLTKAERIYIPNPVKGLDLNLMFMPGSIILRDPEAMWNQARARWGGQISSGRVRERDSFEDYLQYNPRTAYEMFCLTPSVEHKTLLRHGRREKVRKTSHLATFKGGPLNSPFRKFVKMPFGWVVWALAHPDLPACAPLWYGLRDANSSWWAEEGDEVGEPITTADHGDGFISPSAYNPDNLRLVSSASGLAYERLYHHEQDDYGDYRVRTATGTKFHPYDESRHRQVVRALGIDYLEPGVRPDEYADLMIEMEG